MKNKNYWRKDILISIVNATAADCLIYADPTDKSKGFKSGFLTVFEDAPDGSKGNVRLLHAFTTFRKPTPKQIKNGFVNAEAKRAVIDADKLMIESLNEIQKSGYQIPE